ncbi:MULTISPECIES: hypothetical protein [Ignavibacterium]|jgi:hypothetical protein|uniref:hypothetical protein n=1 Tax=Ignavibacterium TaxID=795750 RepID=UPI0025C36284|nr:MULTISPECIES: hypothetical protein [Ignavibacterium]MBI5663223.1 hypothetical protein [Ignavibacterium album]
MKNFILLPLVALLLTGCYTQIALDKDKSSTDSEYYYSQSEDQSNDDYVSEETYSDTLYDKEGNEYHYHFYGYPIYRKYYWGYYPSLHISIAIGNPWWYYDPWYWDPWFCDPWYPIVSYFPPYWYTDYFWYPRYYGTYWTYRSPIYKYRTNDGFRIRNSSGFRNNLVTRNEGNRGTGELLRDQLRTRERSLLTTRNDDHRERKILNNRDRQTDTRIRTNDQLLKSKENTNENRNRIEVQKRKDVNENERPRIEIRNREQTDNRNRDVRKEYEIRKRPDERKPPQIKRNENTESRTPRYNSGDNRNKAPERTYTPRSYNPPKYNTPPPRQNTTPPPRNNDSGNRSGSNRSRR